MHSKSFILNFPVLRLLAALVISAVATNSLYGQAGTASWDGGSGSGASWSTKQNWGNVTAPTAGWALVFTSAATRLTNINDITAGTAFWSINFSASAGAYTLTGNSLSLSNGITNSSASTQTFALAGITLLQNQTFNASAGNIVFTNTNSISLGANTLTIDGAFNTTINSVVSQI